MIKASARDKGALGVSLGVHLLVVVVLAWTAKPVRWSWEASGEESQEVTLWIEAHAPAGSSQKNEVEAESGGIELSPVVEESPPEASEIVADNVPKAAPVSIEEPLSPPPELSEPSEPTAAEPPVPTKVPAAAVATREAPAAPTPPVSENTTTAPSRARPMPRPTKPAVASRTESRPARERAPTRATGSTTAGGAASQSGSAGSGSGGKPSKGSVSARPWRTPAPPYPAEAKSRGWQGVVSLRVRVGANGLPQTVEIARSSGHGVLDEQARRTVASQWKFRAAEMGGQPVASTVTVPVRFALRR